jgi:hypothetical protein
LIAAGNLSDLRETFAGGAEVSVETIFVAALERAQTEEIAA